MRDGAMAPACRDASIAACAMDVFARTCGIAIHAVLVGRAAVRHVGGFDESLHTCEDWDLWQRVARLGGTWVHVDATLAFYRASERSLSHDVERMVDDAASVIGRGHGPDPRLHGRHVAHPDGAKDVEGRAACTALSYFALWCAAFACGHGRTGMPLLQRAEALPHDPEHADAIVATLFDGVMVGQRVVPSQLASRWTMYGARIGALITSLTRSWDDVRAARRLQLSFEHLVLQHDDLAQPRALALSLGLRVDLRRPTGVALPSGVGRVYARLCNGEDLLAVHAFDASTGVTVREWLEAAAVALGRRRVVNLAGAAVARAAVPWRIASALRTLGKSVLRGANAREAAWQTLLAAAGPPAAPGGGHDEARLQQ